MEWWQIAVPLTVAVVLLLSGLPIAFTLGLCGLVGFLIVIGFDKTLPLLGVHCYSAVDNFLFSPIPLFILMAEILHFSGIGASLYDTAAKWFGQLRGGLSIASVAACGVFAAMCGLSIAGAVTIGVIAIPEMIKRGYNKRLAVGSVAVAGTLGILIPPSLPFIVYGVVAEQSIGRLFMAGIIPGIVLMGLFSTYILLRARMHPEWAPGVAGITWKDKILSVRQLWSAVLLILLVLGGIYLGVATPTEAAGLGAFGAMCLALIYRRLKLSDLVQAAWRTAGTCGFVLILVVGAMFFSLYLTTTGITQNLATSIASLEVSRWVIMIGVNLLLLALGFFLDATAIILLTTPVLLPIITSLGFDPIWYGVILVINLEIAFITPPVGLNLYAIRRVAPDIPLSEILLGSIPFLLLACLGIALVMIFPQLALWLPSTMMR